MLAGADRLIHGVAVLVGVVDLGATDLAEQRWRTKVGAQIVGAVASADPM